MSITTQFSGINCTFYAYLYKLNHLSLNSHTFKNQFYTIKNFFMKKTLLVAFLICVTTLAQAKIWRVNNTGVAADFTAAQAAHDGAATGDTLHFEPSVTIYGTLTVTKKLTIIGNGYFLGSLASNSNANLQANVAFSRIAGLIFNNGSQNSVVMGISADYIYFNATANISARNNRIYTATGIVITNSNNIQILQNYLPFEASLTGTGATSMQINNNIVGNTVNMDAASNGDFRNNVVISQNGYSFTFSNFRIWNNIVSEVYSPYTTFTTCNILNNISAQNIFGALNGNQQNVAMSTVFNDFPNTDPAYSEDSRFTLKAGSPAIGTANGGGDRGIFGTSTGNAYNLSGIPSVPSIYNLSAPSSVNGNTLNITISTRTN